MRRAPTTIAAVLLGVGVVLTLAAGGDVPEAPAPAAERDAPAVADSDPFRAGVCWVGPADPAGLDDLAERGVRWLSVTPFAYGHSDPHLPPEGGYRASRFRGESLEGIREVVRAAHARDLRVLVKPHVWFSTSDAWRGDIAMRSEEDWERWFAAYQAFLDPFVTLAAEEGIAAFCVGTELAGTIGREAEWRALVADVRARFPGRVTYAANWHDETAALPFWDALDWIGVQAYFPLTTSRTPTEEELRAGWEPWKRQLAGLAREHRRPIVFTEVGYRPEHDNGREPWVWRVQGEFDPEAQLRAYRAMFSALEGESWLGGMHIWKWFAGAAEGERPRRRRHDGFSPQGLPAEALILETFRKWAPAAAEPTSAPASRPAADAAGAKG